MECGKPRYRSHTEGQERVTDHVGADEIAIAWHNTQIWYVLIGISLHEL
jgi:hypothetical protein